jgi:hypothetical protein
MTLMSCIERGISIAIVEFGCAVLCGVGGWEVKFRWRILGRRRGHQPWVYTRVQDGVVRLQDLYPWWIATCVLRNSQSRSCTYRYLTTHRNKEIAPPPLGT